MSSTAGNTVPMAVQKQLVATWVELKQLLRQQIGSTMDAVHKVPFFLGCGEVWPSVTPGYQLHVASYLAGLSMLGTPPNLQLLYSSSRVPSWKSTIKPMQHKENDGRKVPGRGINSPFLELDGSEMVLLLGINLHGYEVSQSPGSQRAHE